MGNIQVLDPHLANLVAAGEVVDRPASAIKEMMENSIDAGATSIAVEIKNGGSSFMRVTDNGCGMDRSDALACLSRHATSKIRKMSDLGAIMTLGFRGEALAAISSVSEFRLMTRRHEDEMGTLVECRDGKIEQCSTIGCPAGTTIVAEALFANIPARRKFLKKDLTETGAVVAVVEKIALSHPNIAIRLIADEKLRFSTEGDGKLLHTIHAILGRDFAKRMAVVDDKTEGIRVWGYIGRPDNVRSNRNQQNFFLNGRYVKSATAVAALEQAFTSYCPADRFPCCVLHLEMHPALVDVNVHPAKLEVKFVSEKSVFYAIYCAVRNSLNQATTSPGASAPLRITADDLKNIEDLSTFKAKTAEDALRIARELEARRGGYTQISAFSGPASGRRAESASRTPASESSAASATSNTPTTPPTTAPTPTTSTAPEAAPPPTPAPIPLIEVPITAGSPDNPRTVGTAYRPQTHRERPDYNPYLDMLRASRESEAKETEDLGPQAAFPDTTHLWASIPEAPASASDPASVSSPASAPSAAESGEESPVAALLAGLSKYAEPEGETDLTYGDTFHPSPIIPEEPAEPRATLSAIVGEEPPLTAYSLTSTIPAPAPLPDYRIGGVLFQCYVMVEVGSRLLLIDKHAAHERILYEQLRENMTRSDGFSQLLLLPIPLAPTAPEYAAAMEFAPEIHAIGFDFRQNEEDQTIELTQIPSEIESSSASDAFLTLLGHLASGTSVASVSRLNHCERALFQASCKAAVKAGSEDDPGHIRWIVEQVLTRNDIRFCPHGRPVALEMTKSEIEHLFHRP